MQGTKLRLTISVIVGVLSGGAVVFGAVANNSEGDVNPLFLTLGGIFAALAGAATYFTEGRSREEKDRDVVLGAALVPVSESLGRLAVDRQNLENRRYNIAKRLVDTAAELAHPSVVCAYYKLSTDVQKSLRLTACSRDYDELPTLIQDDDSKGAFLLEIARGEKDRYVKKLSSDPDNWRIRLSYDHKTALFIPVRAGSASQGLLILEAPKTGAIPEGEAKKKLLIIAHLIGACQAIPDTPPGPGLPGQQNGSPPVPPPPDTGGLTQPRPSDSGDVSQPRG